jgi:NAD(P)H-quinone oxidoreductase subunit 5
MLIWAAAGKSAQIPFSGWLPRAMEGPTPSSAIFYGAISVHLGAYLLLRCEPLLKSSPIAAWVLVALGLSTAIHGTLVGRACADAKTSLAYASLAQLGLIFAEAGMGWSTLALIHVIGHGCTRTLQFLRAPSMLHDYHQVHAASGGHLEVTSFWQLLAPKQIRTWLYRLALDRGHHDTVLDRLFVAPVLGIAKLLRRATPEGQDA